MASRMGSARGAPARPARAAPRQEDCSSCFLRQAHIYCAPRIFFCRAASCSTPPGACSHPAEMYALVGPSEKLRNGLIISDLQGDRDSHGKAGSPMPRLARWSFPEWTRGSGSVSDHPTFAFKLVRPVAHIL